MNMYRGIRPMVSGWSRIGLAVVLGISVALAGCGRGTSGQSFYLTGGQSNLMIGSIGNSVSLKQMPNPSATPPTGNPSIPTATPSWVPQPTPGVTPPWLKTCRYREHMPPTCNRHLPSLQLVWEWLQRR